MNKKLNHVRIPGGPAVRHEGEAVWWEWLSLIGYEGDVTYEPIRTGKYIPDFELQGQSPLMLEVKSVGTYEELEAELTPRVVNGAAKMTPHGIAIAGGQWHMPSTSQPPALPPPSAIDIMGPNTWTHFPRLGPFKLTVNLDDCGAAEVVGDAMRWAHCNICNRPALFVNFEPYVFRPCGHDLDGGNFSPLFPSKLTDMHEKWHLLCESWQYHPKSHPSSIGDSFCISNRASNGRELPDSRVRVRCSCGWDALGYTPDDAKRKWDGHQWDVHSRIPADVLDEDTF